jgi:hypothetical protein
MPGLKDTDLAMPEEELFEEMLAKTRLSRDMRAASRLLSPAQQRMLVDLYYQLQDDRKRAFNQLRASQEEPNEFVTMLSAFLLRLEKTIVSALDEATDVSPRDRWAKQHTGMGPVLTAGLAAYIDITKTPSVSCLWALAGLNPDQKWEKGQKRPWNAKLKVLRWKISDSFKKLHNHPKCIYGQLYAERKLLELERNERGDFQEQAERTLATVRIVAPETRAWYEQGKLPPGRLDLRAMRYSVKRFLSHYFHVAWEVHYGTDVPLPYVFVAPDTRHTHYIPPYGWPLEE